LRATARRSCHHESPSTSSAGSRGAAAKAFAASAYFSALASACPRAKISVGSFWASFGSAATSASKRFVPATARALAMLSASAPAAFAAASEAAYFSL